MGHTKPHSNKTRSNQTRKKLRKTSKTGVKKYKVATAAQDQRMDKIEAAVEAIALKSMTQQEDPRIKIMEMHIKSIAKSQCNTVEAIKHVIQGQGETKAFVKELTKKVKYNKKQADDDHKIMTDAMKLFHDNLVQSQTMINALQKGRESPTCKKCATSQQRPSTNSDHDSDESSFNSTKMCPYRRFLTLIPLSKTTPTWITWRAPPTRISTPDNRGGGKINMSLLITSPSSNRSKDEHGSNRDTQRQICLVTCERAVCRLYITGEDLLYAEQHPFRDPIENLLLQPVQMQDLWIDKTTAYLRKAFQQQRARPRGQPAITNFFAQQNE
jgi:hypothetical protein